MPCPCLVFLDADLHSFLLSRRPRRFDQCTRTYITRKPFYHSHTMWRTSTNRSIRRKVAGCEGLWSVLEHSSCYPCEVVANASQVSSPKYQLAILAKPPNEPWSDTSNALWHDFSLSICHLHFNTVITVERYSYETYKRMFCDIAVVGVWRSSGILCRLKLITCVPMSIICSQTVNTTINVLII